MQIPNPAQVCFWTSTPPHQSHQTPRSTPVCLRLVPWKLVAARPQQVSPNLLSLQPEAAPASATSGTLVRGPDRHPHSRWGRAPVPTVRSDLTWRVLLLQPQGETANASGTGWAGACPLSKVKTSLLGVKQVKRGSGGKGCPEDYTYTYI